MLTTTVLSKEKTREDVMKDIDSLRRNELYLHDQSDCSERCQQKGTSLLQFVRKDFILKSCKNLRVIDSCWKVCMPHCMFAVENEVHGYPLINFPDVCTNEPMANSVFCKRSS
ncbi:hypothetical protein KUTeg_014262 [Tegillarca granosa]|uniref:Uncharacterized protein n=1 Tax=Tegillarca granosa TaxID=220873 RepID=A0ABQ9F1I1_TEGGR|nr:hypothetical protein KUTeg_014262 [Tegillarca granosa]